MFPVIDSLGFTGLTASQVWATATAFFHNDEGATMRAGAIRRLNRIALQIYEPIAHSIFVGVIVTRSPSRSTW